ncbi:SIR2 family protein [Pseudomonas sp. BP01]|uniref:SIR2 family protein n=1 Tax=Pseudomonas sp. BP01 TaxID=2976152 RepID=UPI001FAA65E5|nr:SIR2 family protein [Pseudomonas sp. BP01]
MQISQRKGRIMSVVTAAVIEKLKQDIAVGDLIVVIGTGVSIGLTKNKRPALSWQGLIADGLQCALQKGKINAEQNERWHGSLYTDDLDDMLGAAEYVGRKLGAPFGDLYARWLETVFSDERTDNSKLEEAIRKITACGTPICTLNYDGLLEKVTGLPAIDLTDLRKSTEWVRRETTGILHLHGQWRKPESCVLGISDYDDAVVSEPRNLIQRNLSTFKRLLFIGCGDTFADPNFSALITWLRENMKSAAPQHYALVTDDQYVSRHADETWHGFVDPLSYGGSHADLPEFISSIFDRPPPGISKVSNAANISSGAYESIIDEYRNFLIRDCGQMTIEGIKTDMDTAQRRFDLEKLFVPLQLEACQPDIPESDPDREEKLKVWLDEHKEPFTFGDVFERTKGLALLALPGGGKTLLLKRLAVAYASPARRANSEDNLPEIDTVPVLIRCREWREYIQLPILTLFKKFADITGQPGLSKFSSAILPRLKSGRVLLLIDGLDEIHVNSDREIFVDNLQKFLSDFPKIRVVITSREAGFNLVAAKVAGFCERWRVAPLSHAAIKELSLHWHRLMAPGSQESEKDALELANHLHKTSSLRRLAENPLLLTMLLVVKHGAGRLPPNKVSLYGRAVEVLLDTWNIKGHEPLNIWEAVPQLAYIALELMQRGVQTATEKELLTILERARSTVPLISRYAKDTPYEFLKRVELRSSLLLEAGHQIENGMTVPFYQFRHLTFQEYLASVALADGHYDNYSPRHSIIRPVAKKLVSDEWKEVVPMLAVLAGKRASPIAAALLVKAKQLYKKAQEKKAFAGSREWNNYPGTLPAPVARLFQMLVEEAQLESQELSETMPLLAYFTRGCRQPYDWRAFARGPYAIDFLDEVWKRFEPMDWDDETWIKNTLSNFLAYMKGGDYINSQEFVEDTLVALSNDSDRVVCFGLMTYVGALWHDSSREDKTTPLNLFEASERLVSHRSAAVSYAATWCWSLSRLNAEREFLIPSVNSLNSALWQLLNGSNNFKGLAAFALSTAVGLQRDYWAPVLSETEVEKIKEYINQPSSANPHAIDRTGLAVVCFHARNILDERKLVKFLVEVLRRDSDVELMLKQLGKLGAKAFAAYNSAKDTRAISRNKARRTVVG